MRRVLVLGGTRHVGRAIVAHCAAEGDHVTIVHRGQTRIPLPPGVDERFADRTDRDALAAAIAGPAWDLVVDTLVWRGDDARLALDLLRGRTARYVVIGTGQVYLVRDGARPPFREDDYDGPLLAEPATGYDRAQWRYGLEKREAEDLLAAAAARDGLPVTTLRLPMVHGPHDPYRRLQHYWWRLKDGHPLLVPEGPLAMVRHVDAEDVARAVRRVAAVAPPPGRAFNIGAATATPLGDLLAALAAAAGLPLQLHPVPLATLEGEGFLPLCGPFSQRWMSALDPARAEAELGVRGRALMDSVTPLIPGLLAETAPPEGFAASRARERRLLADA